MRYEIEPGWQTNINNNIPELRLPPSFLANQRTYRIRARYQDQTGRCSRWSAPIQFTAGKN